jgi:hypothetical protein
MQGVRQQVDYSQCMVICLSDTRVRRKIEILENEKIDDLQRFYLPSVVSLVLKKEEEEVRFSLSRSTFPLKPAFKSLTQGLFSLLSLRLYNGWALIANARNIDAQVVQLCKVN